MKPLCPVSLSAVTVSLLAERFRDEQRKAKEEVLCQSGIERRISEGIERTQERERIQFAHPIAAIQTAGGGWDRRRQ